METNQFFALHHEIFKRACLIADIPATRRQASKWRNKKGKAWQFKNQATSEIGRGITATERKALSKLK